MDDHRMGDAELPNTPVMVEFLAATLSTFMVVRKNNGKPWSKRSVANWITTRPEIQGTLDDTTLGRFLNPDYPQAPSADTIRVVAEFLLVQRAITKRDIELHMASPVARLAAAINALHAFSDSKAEAEFTQALAGTYISAKYESGYLVHSWLYLSYDTEAKVLLADETLQLYRIGDDRQFRARTDNLSALHSNSIQGIIKSCSGRQVFRSNLSGFVVANRDTCIALLGSEVRGLTTAINILGIQFDDDNRIMALSTLRNSGWAAEVPANESIPGTINADTRVHEVVKIMSRNFTYSKKEFEKGRKFLGFTRNIEKYNISVLSETDNTSKKHLEELMERRDGIQNHDWIDKDILERMSPNEKLAHSIEFGWLDLFKDALALGADANLVMEGDSEAIVFGLAANGQRDWLEALLASGRCDLTGVDRHGMDVSYAPSVNARRFATVHEVPQEAQHFAEIANLLRNRRAHQLQGKVGAVPTLDM